VRNWSKFQHYHHRRPPWVKLHRSLLDDRIFLALPFASQALAPRLWLLASESEDGSISNDPIELAFRLRCDVQTVTSAVKSLIDGGFLEGELLASTTLAPCLQHATTEKSREETETEKRIAAPPALAPSWSREACDDWIAQYHGTAPGGRIGKALSPLVKANGWTSVRTAWRSYLAQTEAEFASPQRFSATFGRWNGSAPAAVSRGGTVTERTEANLKAWIASKEEKV